MQILFLLTGIILGSVAAWFMAKSRYDKSLIDNGLPIETYNQLDKEKSILQDRLYNLQQEKEQLRAEIISEKKILNAELTNERDKLSVANNRLAKAEEAFKNMQDKLDTQKDEMEKLQQKFTTEFENIANRILDEKSKKFTEQNKTNIEETLKPLREKITDFQKRVEETYDKESKQRFSLENEVRKLADLNVQMSKDATNLTRALKGENKIQGNWGEMILENVLEKSGLVKNTHYEVQTSFTNSEGRRVQPDVIINLPDNKHIVIDAKMSLVAYESYHNSEDEVIKANAIKEHIASIRSHIKLLSEKNYQNLEKLKTPDFVLMFVPIEPAFNIAVQHDLNLFTEAFDRNIVIVSTSTLLATLRTIASIWRQENQNKNAIEIARLSGDMYDKFVGFIGDLTIIGNKIDDSQKAYHNALNKLDQGKGNLIRTAERIKTLGAKTTKALPEKFNNTTEELTENLID